MTPGRGTLTLSREDDPRLFRLARVGLGALGVVSEVTLQLGPSHQLLEHTYVASAQVCAPRLRTPRFTSLVNHWIVTIR